MSAGPKERPDPRASARTCVVSLPLVVRRVLRGARRALHGCWVSLVVARDRLCSLVWCSPFDVNNQRTTQLCPCHQLKMASKFALCWHIGRLHADRRCIS